MGIKEKVSDAATGAASCSFALVMFILNQIALWGGIALHLFTVLMICSRHGIIIGAISLAFPVLSEIYMFIRCWIEVGFLNLYTLLFLSIPFLYVFIIGLYATVSFIASVFTKEEL